MQRQWMRTILKGLGGLALASSLAACGASPSGTNAYAGSSSVDVVRRGAGGVTRFLAKNLYYRLDPTMTMFLTDMNADIVLKDPTLPFVPANKTDYSIAIHHAVVDKDALSLEALMNNYVFTGPNSPLKELKLSFSGNQLIMAGKMKKLGLWTAFSMAGTLEPTADGLIRMNPTVIKSVDGLRVDGLLNFLGLDMQKLLKTEEDKGVAIRGNTVIMDPAHLYPPPILHGKVTVVGVKNNRLHIEFDDGKAQPWPVLPVANPAACMCMWGGDVLIDASLNLNAKMELIDTTPNTPMVFALDRYREQLEAGVVIPTREGHMIAYVPDIMNFTADLGRYAPTSYPVPGINVPAADPGITSAEHPAPQASP